MKHPLYEQEQARKVRTQFRMLQHAQKISHNVSQTCQFFGISRAHHRFEKYGMRVCGTGPRTRDDSLTSHPRSSR